MGCRSQVVRAAVGAVGAGPPKATASPWKLPDRRVVPVRASDGATLSGLLVANPLVGPLLVRGSMGAKAPTEDLRQIGVMFAATVTEARRGFLRSIQAMDLSDAVTSIDLPVLVAVGSLDRLTPPGLSRRLVEALPDAYLVTVPEAGHMLPIEAPDQVAFLLGELAAGSAPVQAGQAWEAQVVTSSSAGTVGPTDRPRADGA